MLYMLFPREAGQTLVELAVILMVVALALVAGLSPLSLALTDVVGPGIGG